MSVYDAGTVPDRAAGEARQPRSDMGTETSGARRSGIEGVIDVERETMEPGGMKR